MKKIIFLTAAALVVAALVLIRIFAITGKKEQAAAPAASQAIPVECTIIIDTVADYQVETVGTLRARDQVDIVSEITRKVVSVPMKEGALVRKGQELFKLDDADIVSRINKLSLQAQLADTREKREKVLLAAGGISQEQYDETSNLRQTLEAEIAVLKVDLAKTEILAPFSGRIGLRNVSIGALVTPGTVLANLQDLSRMLIDFSIPERYANHLKPGSPVTFRTDYLPDPQTATVEAVEPSVNLQTRTLTVRALVPDPGGNLVPGTSARVFVRLTDEVPGLMVPSAALIPSIRGYSVFLVKGGKAVLAPVKTGNRGNERVQVLEGAHRGDTLITTNLLRVRNGSPIRIQKIN